MSENFKKIVEFADQVFEKFPDRRDSEFHDGLGWNLDLLLRLRIKTEVYVICCDKDGGYCY
jgi:hypothetical protein